MRERIIWTAIIMTTFGAVLGWLSTSYMYQKQVQYGLAGTPVYGVGGGPDVPLATQTVETLVRTWDPHAQNVAHDIQAVYGPPQEMTPSRLLWFTNGPWKRTIVYGDGALHNFPYPHVETLEQTISYHVPADRLADVSAFDGSVVANRTRGELTSSSDSEAMNFLALNLANDIVIHHLTTDQARQQYAQTAKALLQGQRPAYTQGLRFATSPTDMGDPDLMY